MLLLCLIHRSFRTTFYFRMLHFIFYAPIEQGLDPFYILQEHPVLP